MNYPHQYQYEYEYKVSGPPDDGTSFYSVRACFPAEGPGVYCYRNHEQCKNHRGQSPDDCPAFVRPLYYCPACLDEGEKTKLFADGDVYVCPFPDCREEFSQSELMARLSDQAADYRKRFEGADLLLRKVERLEEQIAMARKAVEVWEL